MFARVGNKLLGVNFRRQHAIGPYIADFCCIEKKLIVELDGSQHLEQQEYDQMRTAYVESQRFCVLRFWNKEVLNDLNGVMCGILENLEHLAG
jgi:very-short-patch-repair endonuclease